MAKNKFNKQWLQDHLKDPYVKMAQKEGYRARAAYKLKEMDEAEKLIRPGMLVVDLGSAPGSWSQYLRNKLLDKGELRGRIIAMDILPMEAVPNVIFLQGDFREDEVLKQLDALVGQDKVDLVVSDMARIAHVCELALEFAQTHLKPEGALLVKAFHGSGYSQIVESFKRVFRVVKPLKPKASRDKSSETFLLGRVLK